MSSASLRLNSIKISVKTFKESVRYLVGYEPGLTFLEYIRSLVWSGGPQPWPLTPSHHSASLTLGKNHSDSVRSLFWSGGPQPWPLTPSHHSASLTLSKNNFFGSSMLDISRFPTTHICKFIKFFISFSRLLTVPVQGTGY